MPGHSGTLPGQPYTSTEPRIIGDFIEHFNVTQGGNCLAVNVWSKRLNNQKKPGVLWACGGSMFSEE
jgi:carboxylesterase type B